tara:strand:- start:619 stop:1359 length:741 start_codon:yes stop_codon:yes gene_type:complete
MNEVEQVKVEWFTPFEGLEDLVPPVSATDCIPEWTKRMPAIVDVPSTPRGPGAKGNYHETATFKVCPGWVDLYREAYILQLWSDCKIKATSKGAQIVFAGSMFEAGLHPNWQYLNHAPTNNYVNTVKLVSPWHIRTSPGWGVLQLPLQYEFNDKFDIAMGIVHTDVLHEVNPQLMIKTEDEISLKVGDPIAMYIPIKLNKAVEKSVSIGYSTVDQIKSYKRGSLGGFLKFTQSYRWLIERLNEYRT